MSKIPRLFELISKNIKKPPPSGCTALDGGFFKKTRRQETIGKNGGLQDCSACIFIIPHAAHKVNGKPQIRNNGKIGGVAQETRQTISPAGFRSALCQLL